LGPAAPALARPVERQLLAISPRQMDRGLAPYKRQLKRRLYGRTKPGTRLKHHIPLKTDHWDITTPGFSEIDLVSHSGDSAQGEFVHSLNLTDIHTAWVETIAVLGKSQERVQQALATVRSALPFRLRGIDSDNGSEFVNRQLWDYCQAQEIQFTRGRPYKKDDNAHIEQKDWTHVRKLLGYVRYDRPEILAAINARYRSKLRWFQNLFLPSVKLVRKERVGARLRRRYDTAQMPLDRVRASPEADPAAVAQLTALRTPLDPFALTQTIERQLERIYALANPTASRPRGLGAHRLPPSGSRPRRPQARPRTADPALRQGRPPPPVTVPSLGYLGDGAMIHPSVTFLNGLTGTRLCRGPLCPAGPDHHSQCRPAPSIARSSVPSVLALPPGAPGPAAEPPPAVTASRGGAGWPRGKERSPC
jgi:hypothetical protein